MMTKSDKVQAINAVISGPRGDLAREKGAKARITSSGALLYTDTAKGYERRISLRELLGYLHGEDIRALKAAFKTEPPIASTLNDPTGATW